MDSEAQAETWSVVTTPSNLEWCQVLKHKHDRRATAYLILRTFDPRSLIGAPPSDEVLYDEDCVRFLQPLDQTWRHALQQRCTDSGWHGLRIRHATGWSLLLNWQGGIAPYRHYQITNQSPAKAQVLNVPPSNSPEGSEIFLCQIYCFQRKDGVPALDTNLAGVDDLRHILQTWVANP